jgi:trimethylamine--corrinoid protein Co-methyltransferase
MKHLKSDFFMPQLVDRRSYDKWAADGSKSMVDRAREKVKWILENHHVVPLELSIQARFEDVIRSAETAKGTT